ncbi:MAG TPA: hypothetical protein VIE64_07845 [Solirubrobacterales bacterium]|jgi:uncharacterized membrane protein YqaE (UPF0057 family)
MGSRASTIFPFAIAIILPPAGVLLGFVELRQDRELGIRLIAVAILAAVVWTLLLLG